MTQSSIGKKLRVFSVALISLWGGLSPAAAASSSDWIYSVKPGDTLISIADSFLSVPSHWVRLQTLNKVVDPKRLIPGTPLRLPVALLKREAVIAEVINMHGNVTVAAPGQAARTLGAHDALRSGDTLVTGLNATLALRFVDGSRLLLTPDSSMTLSDLAVLGKSGIPQTVLRLNRGSVDTEVAKQQPASRYEIKSNALNLAVRGTSFRAHVVGTDQAARAEVLEGTVMANGVSGKGFAVAAGFGAVATPNNAPTAPQMLLRAPDLNSTGQLTDSLPLRFTWTQATDAQRYRAQVFADRTFSSLLLDGVFTTSNAKWVDLPDGRYVLRVRGIDQNGLEGLNADADFTLKARPEPPAINAPQQHGKVYGPQTTLRWSLSTSAPTYHVQISAQADFAKLLADAPAVASNEYQFSLDPGQYFWRIASVAAGPDQGPFSDVQDFTVRKIPESPTAEPPQMDEKSLSFSWRAGDAGSKYQFQLAAKPDFSQPLVDQTLDVNQTKIDRPEPGNYFLRIKTIDAYGFAGPFGAAQLVDVPPPPAKPWWLLGLLLLIH